MKPTEILVVEDEAIIAMEIQARLEEMGYAVAGVASRGEQAIEIASKTRPGLTLMDIILRGEMDGVEAA